MSSSSNPHLLPSNYYDDERPMIRGVLALFMVLATVSVAVRIACQVKVHRQLFWDDFWIVLAAVLVDAASAVNFYGLRRGLGLHATRVRINDHTPPSAFIALWKVGYVGNILNSTSLFAVKMSLLLLYKRVFSVARWFRIAWWANLIYAVCWVIEALFTGVFRCIPVSYAWNRMYLWMHVPAPFPVEGTCISEYFITVNCALSIASDIGIWALPMFALLGLQISKQRKFGLGLLLSLGVLAVACGIGKAVSSYSSLSTGDTSWDVAPFAIWSEAEQAVAILCACIPTIVGGVRNMLKKHRETKGASPYRSIESGGEAVKLSKWSKIGSGRTSITQEQRVYTLPDGGGKALSQKTWDSQRTRIDTVRMTRPDRDDDDDLEREVGF